MHENENGKQTLTSPTNLATNYIFSRLDFFVSFPGFGVNKIKMGHSLMRRDHLN